MKKLDEEGEALVEAKCCDVCKHFFYTGLPGAYACDHKGFVDVLDTCDDWEMSDEIGVENEDA